MFLEVEWQILGVAGSTARRPPSLGLEPGSASFSLVMLDKLLPSLCPSSAPTSGV